jgi:hypothetical protein
MSAPFSDELFRAVADYALQFPDANSLGTNAATWLTEMARIRRTAFAAILINASATEGANASGLRNFPQQVLADALHCRRYDLDSAYVLPPHLAAYPSAKIERARAGTRRGITLRFGR